MDQKKKNHEVSVRPERTTAHASALIEVPIQSVALVAASLSIHGMSGADAVRKAYELLELVQAAKISIGSSATHWEQGIGLLERSKSSFEDCRAFTDKANKSDLTLDDSGQVLRHNQTGKPLPVPYEKMLTEVLGPYSKSGREDLFVDWLASAENKSPKEANRQVVAWKKEGVPAEVYQSFRLLFPSWKRQQASLMRQQNGKKGGGKSAETRSAKAKAKSSSHGRVKHRKDTAKAKKDSRLGAKF